ncbi:MAG: M36 family metallopeptidase [Acidobacteriota bacterium]|nr:M36 family metallopeptidase [Acidobacteriota bacterium]
MLIIFGLLAAFTVLPFQFSSSAGGQNVSSKQSQPSSEENSDYYDIRTDKSVKSAELLEKFRNQVGRDAASIADVRDNFARGEASLRRKVPTLKIEYGKELRNPEVIAPDVLQGRAVLTSPSGEKRSDILRNFARENNALIGMSDWQINNLKVTADYKNPAGELSFARLEQFIDDIPVFRAEIRAGFTARNEMFRVVNNLAPALDYANLSKEFGDPADAVRRAAAYIDYELKAGETTRNQAASTDLKAVFGTGDWATTAEKMYFPTEPGVARAAWRVLNWQKGDAYYVIVDAETGAMLYRENITHSQTQAATYNVYANTTSMVKTMANPAPLSPNPISPAFGTQGSLQPRTNVTLIGNEAPYTFNNNGWITDNTNGANGITDGNNVEAGVDRDLPNGVDAPVQGTNRVFNFNYTPAAGADNGPGDDPSLPAYQNGAATNLFYVTNRFHDETYLLGFTEQARNFQHSNFGRGGAENDRISAEAQDNTVGSFCPAQPCVNNANFSTPADGGRGRMQMYIWNRMNPDRDGDLDADIIVHELAHGLFGRLHNGLGGTQSAQMNEGNADFFGHVMLALNTDPINGVYPTGGYSTLNLNPNAPFSNTGNYYYGIRRFPKAVMAFTGGPNNRPHNPLTYADIDPAQMNLNDGAFPPAAIGTATGSHNGGEIWSSMLWEVRAKMVQRLGAEAGNKKVLQVVMDGMKVSPSSPTMLQERNAILAAAQAGGSAADVADIWAGFAIRGLGFSAANPSGNTVVEGFDVPSAQTPKSRADFDGDGKTDLSVFRPSDSVWYLNRSTAGFTATQFGVASDVLTPGDYDGDGKTDLAVFRPGNGYWYRVNSGNGQFVATQFGQNGDVPQAGDFDGDGKDDLAVWRPTDGAWYRINSGNGQFVGAQFGANGDKPVAGDYDSDGKDDLAVFRPGDGTWYRINSGNGQFTATQFGLASDLAAPADYDGDNKEDICVFRPGDGTWYRLNSSNGGLVVIQFGASGDVPVPGDYDGDGRDDQAVFRGGTWYLNRSTSGFAGAGFGLGTDRAVPKSYIP